MNSHCFFIGNHNIEFLLDFNRKVYELERVEREIGVDIGVEGDFLGSDINEFAKYFSYLV